jgi:hypothetical protein
LEPEAMAIEAQGGVQITDADHGVQIAQGGTPLETVVDIVAVGETAKT